MAKPWNKKPDKHAARRQLKMLESQLTPEQKAAMKCGAHGCADDGIAAHQCITCEQLVAAGRRKEVFTVFSCGDARHREAVLRKVRKHAVTKHPANLLRVMAAGLRGEEI